MGHVMGTGDCCVPRDILKYKKKNYKLCACKDMRGWKKGRIIVERRMGYFVHANVIILRLFAAQIIRPCMIKAFSFVSTLSYTLARDKCDGFSTTSCLLSVCPCSRQM